MVKLAIKEETVEERIMRRDALRQIEDDQGRVIGYGAHPCVIVNLAEWKANRERLARFVTD